MDIKDNMNIDNKYLECINGKNCDHLYRLPNRTLEQMVYKNSKEETKKERVDTIKSIKAYLKQSKGNGYRLIKEYQFSKELQTQGRRYVVGYGIQKMKKNVRGFLLQGINTDYDMVNAHPTILLWFVKKYYGNSPIAYLKEYVNKREEVLKKNNLSKHEVLKVINKDKLTSEENKNDWLKNFHQEIKQIQNRVYEDHHQKFPKEKEFNKKASVLNKILCINEDTILMECVSKLKKLYDIDIQTPMYDGFTCICPDLKGRLNTMTREYDIKWVVKPHETDIELEEIEEEEEDLKSYEETKIDFEENNFMVRNPVGFYSIINGVPVQYSKDKFETLHGSVWYVSDDATKGFIKKWLKDPKHRIYDNVDFILPPNICPDNTYNLFTGFEYQKWTEVLDDSTNIDTLLNHVRLLSGDDRTNDVYNYLLNYLAHMIQYPGILPRVALVLKSIQGIGKNLFFDNFGACFGTQYVLSTADPNHITGRFNNIDKKILCNYDEASGKDTFSNNDKIKEMITTESIICEKKGKDAYDITNCMRIVFFSNNDTPVKIEATDRRFQVIECSNKKGDVNYYNNLYNALKDRRTMLKFIDYLKQRDISNFNFEKNRVETEYYKALKSVNTPLTSRWLYSLCLTKDVEKPFTGYECLESYKAWMKEHNYDNNITLQTWGCKIKEFIDNGIKKKKTMRGREYTIDRDVLLNTLYEKGYILEDEMDYIKYK